MLEWGLIIILCVALVWIYLNRDNGRWETCKTGIRDVTDNLKQQSDIIIAQKAFIKEHERRIGDLVQSIKDQRTAFEQINMKLEQALNEKLLTSVNTLEEKYARDLGNIQVIVKAFQSAFEEDFNGVEKKCEAIKNSQKRISREMYRIEALAGSRPVEITILDDKNQATLRKVKRQLDGLSQ